MQAESRNEWALSTAALEALIELCIVLDPKAKSGVAFH